MNANSHFFLKFFHVSGIFFFFLILALCCYRWFLHIGNAQDEIFVFDQWYYFYQRLAQGEFPQWNPFNLLGAIASKWNYVPVSMYTPFLQGEEFTLNAYFWVIVGGTFLSLCSVYLSGVILTKNKIIPLFLVFLLGTSSVYWGFLVWPFFTTFFTFYPIATAVILSPFLRYSFPSKVQWIAGSGLLALSFVGLKLEYVFNVTLFHLICATSYLLFYLFKQKQAVRLTFKAIIQELKKRYKHILFFGVFLFFPILSNIWHLVFSINTTIESYRVSPGFRLEYFFDPTLWKYLISSMIFQAPLVLVGFLVTLQAISSSKRISVHFTRFMFSKIQSKNIIIFFSFFLGVYALTIVYQYYYGAAIVSFLERIPRYSPVPGTVSRLLQKDSFYMLFAIPPLLLCLINLYYKAEARCLFPNIFTLCVFLTKFFLGIWAAQTLAFDVIYHIENGKIFIFYLLVCLGSYKLLCTPKKEWLVGVILLHHFVGEIGVFITDEVFGVPIFNWRMVPFRLIFYLYICYTGIRYLLNTLEIIVKNNFPSLSSSKTCCLSTTFQSMLLCLSLYLISNNQIFNYSYSTLFFALFQDTQELRFVNHPPWSKAMNQSKDLRKQHISNKVALQREFVGDEEVGEVVNLPTFFPSVYGILNSFYYHNSSTMPKEFVNIFQTSNIPNVYNFAKHPQSPYLFRVYKLDEIYKRNIKPTHAFNYVVVRPHIVENPIQKKLSLQVLAEKGQGINRVFLIDKVRLFHSLQEERSFLFNLLEKKNNKITTILTTSDKTFSPRDVLNNENEEVFLEGNVQMLKDYPENIVLDVFSNKNAYLVLLDSYSKGWTAKIGLKKAQIYRAYLGTRFIKIPPGHHRVEFNYSLPGLSLAKAVSFGAFVLFCILFLPIKRNRNEQI